MDVTAKNFIKRIALLLAAALVLLVAVSASGDSIRLHDQAGTLGPNVTLAQIAELEGVQAEQLSETIVTTLANKQTGVTISIEAVRRELEKEGVNWADVSLRGYASCRVHLIEEAVSLQADPAEAVAANTRDEVTLKSTMTLRDLVTERVAQVAGSPLAQLRIAFDDRDIQKLSQPTFAKRYEIEPHTGQALGRVVFKVRRYEMDQLADSFTIRVDVAKRTLAAVTTQPIRRGNAFRSDAYEVREVYIDSLNIEPITDGKLLLGQTAGRTLREGSIITPDDVRSAVMVKRGELVTVRCVVGNLVVRMSARAMEEGAMGETIRVRNERSREKFTVHVTGRRQAAMADETETPTEGAAS